jgi:glycosyltransferase involved in cell wall biosynthesis
MRVLLDARMGRKLTGIGSYVMAVSAQFAQLAPGTVRPLCHPMHWLRFRRLELSPVVALSGKGLPRWLPPVDVVHGPNFHAPAHPNAAKVATVHDLGYRRLPDCHPPGMPERLDALVRAALPDTSLFLCDSADTRQDFLEAYCVEEDRCRVVPLGVDTEVFSPVGSDSEAARLRKRYGLERPFFLYVGAMVPRKDLLTLVRAFEEVAAHIPEAELVLAGNKTLRWASDWPKVEAWLADRPALAARVRVLDYLPAAMLPALYRASQVVVLTSLLEGFGLTVLEGFASGRPVVATRAGALTEVGGTAAYYGEARDPASFAQAMRAAWEGDGASDRAHEARSIVEAHTWRRTAELTLAAYAAAVEAPTRAGLTATLASRD